MIWALILGLALGQNQHGILAPNQVVLANHNYVAYLPDGDKVSLLEVDAADNGLLQVVWPQSRLRPAYKLKFPETRKGGRDLWFVYKVPAGGGDMPMSRWVHDPGVAVGGEKVRLGEDTFAETIHFPKDATKATLSLGVPFSFPKTYRNWKLAPAPAKEAAWLGESKDPKKVVITVDLVLDPGALEFSGFAKTSDGHLHPGEVANWETDKTGRLKREGLQNFVFEGIDKRNVVGFSLRVRRLAYVQFRDVPLTR